MTTKRKSSRLTLILVLISAAILTGASCQEKEAKDGTVSPSASANEERGSVGSSQGSASLIAPVDYPRDSVVQPPSLIIEEPVLPNLQRVVLVAGHWFDADTFWTPVKAALENLACEVVVVDLLEAKGNDAEALAKSEQALVRAAVGDKRGVILVAHSTAGAVITRVVEEIDTQVAKLVYVGAILPGNGKSMGEIIAGDSDAALHSLIVDGAGKPVAKSQLFLQIEAGIPESETKANIVSETSSQPNLKRPSVEVGESGKKIKEAVPEEAVVSQTEESEVVADAEAASRSLSSSPVTPKDGPLTSDDDDAGKPAISGKGNKAEGPQVTSDIPSTFSLDPVGLKKALGETADSGLVSELVRKLRPMPSASLTNPIQIGVCGQRAWKSYVILVNDSCISAGLQNQMATDAKAQKRYQIAAGFMAPVQAPRDIATLILKN